MYSKIRVHSGICVLKLILWRPYALHGTERTDDDDDDDYDMHYRD